MPQTTAHLTHIQMQSKQGSEGLGHHNDCVAEVGKIDHEQWQGSHGGKQELVSPPQVQHIISKAQEDHATNSQKCTNHLYKLTKNNNTENRVEFEISEKNTGLLYINRPTSSCGKPMH